MIRTACVAEGWDEAMPSTSRSGRGLLCVAGAIGLGIVTFLFPYVWDIFLPASGSGDTGTFSYTLHTVWIPLSGLVLMVGTAASFVFGFLLVWRDRAHVDPGQRAVLGLAMLAFAIAAGAAGLLAFLGVVAGLVYTPDLHVPKRILDIALAIATGLSLYWLLSGVGVRQARLAGLVALVAGSVSSVFAVVWGEARIDGAGTIAVTAGFLSLTLWLALFLWGYDELRLRGLSRPAGLPA